MFKYREFYTHSVIRFISALSIVGVTLCCYYFDGYATILALALGALVYAIAEYVVHRYLLHEFPRLLPVLYRGHAEHHRQPQEMKYLFSPVHYDILIYCVYIPLVWLLFRRISVVAPVVTGTLLFQLYYQWMHYAAHRPVVPRTAWGRWMKKKHLLHHYKDEYAWYGVSHPVLDYAMGTHKESDRPARKAGTETENSSSFRNEG